MSDVVERLEAQLLRSIERENALRREREEILLRNYDMRQEWFALWNTIQAHAQRSGAGEVLEVLDKAREGYWRRLKGDEARPVLSGEGEGKRNG